MFTFLIFAQNIECGFTLEPPPRGEAVLTNTHDLCFGAKNKKIRYIPVYPSFAIRKVGFKCVNITLKCFRDV